MRYTFAIALARLLRIGVRLVRPGGGSALPGLLLSKLAPGLLSRVLVRFPQGLVVVSGSAGKSTTTKMLVAICRAHGLRVFTNPSTANISQGFFSAIVEQSNLRGVIPGDVAILEMDEGHAAEILGEVAARQVTLLNVLEDQLDRFVDPANVSAKLLTAAQSATSAIVMNADDQNLVYLAQEGGSALAETSWFGVAREVLDSAKNGQGIAKTYRPTLARPKVVSEVSQLQGKVVSISTPAGEATLEMPNRGLHFAVDSVAALESARRLLEGSFSLDLATKTLNELPPVFARGEMVEIKGSKVEFNLVQNPTSFQLNLDNLSGHPERLMIAIGRDVHDPSWLWTVDFSGIKRVDVVSGFNAGEMALRLAYAGVVIDNVIEDLDTAMEAFLNLPEPQESVRTVLFSADSMRRLRRSLGFTSPEEVER